jgi:uncharacterized protein (DUF362 family)
MRDCSTISRRAFLESAILGCGSLLCPALLSASEAGAKAEKKPRVVIVQDTDVLADGKINGEIAERMVHRAVCLFAGKEDQALAWKSLFSPKEKIAIKVNTRYPPVIGNREVVMAVVDGLKGAGVEENHIIVYDLTDEELEKVGYKLNDSSKGLRCHTSREHREMMAGPVKVKVSKILTDYADAIVNVPAFRHHVKAGVTISLKNHLGSVQNPRDFHGDGCSHVADLNALDPIRKKTRLIVVDAIRGQYNFGPTHVPWYVWNYTGLILGTDPVAVDSIAAEEMDNQRRKKGMDRPIRPTIKHLHRAAEMGLGVADLGNIGVVRETA